MIRSIDAMRQTMTRGANPPSRIDLYQDGLQKPPAWVAVRDGDNFEIFNAGEEEGDPLFIFALRNAAA